MTLVKDLIPSDVSNSLKAIREDLPSHHPGRITNGARHGPCVLIIDLGWVKASHANRMADMIDQRFGVQVRARIRPST